MTCYRVTPVYDPANVRLDSTARTLIVTGGFDHVTPPSLGRQVDQQLANSVIVEVGPVGHAPLEAIGPCGQQLVTDFLQQPDTRPDDTCARELSLRLVTSLPPGVG